MLFQPDRFEDIGDVGMWVSRTTVMPLGVEPVGDLIAALAMRPTSNCTSCHDLLPLKGVWESSLHASGVRLRNAARWGEPGWPHSSPSVAQS
jgi:hypothetical protein